MKTRTEKLLTALSIAALMVAATATFLPTKSVAYVAADKQYVATTCSPSGNSCNNCSSGSKECTDHTCAQCAPAQ